VRAVGISKSHRAPMSSRLSLAKGLVGSLDWTTSGRSLDSRRNASILSAAFGAALLRERWRDHPGARPRATIRYSRRGGPLARSRAKHRRRRRLPRRFSLTVKFFWYSRHRQATSLLHIAGPLRRMPRVLFATSKPVTAKCHVRRPNHLRTRPGISGRRARQV
jgi:hypothetical protein